ncbi:MAG: type II secretion system protein [Patescibacteria group bacterium]
MKKFNQGFTLVEIIVSLGIFAVVALVAVGAFLKVVDANKKAQALKTAVNNLNFALETMSRELRTSFEYTNVSGNIETIEFQPLNDIDRGCDQDTEPFSIRYRLNTTENTIEKSEGCSGSADLSDYASIVSRELNVTKMEFNIINEGSLTAQPMVRITLSGYAGMRERDKSYFNLQTTVSQRAME